MIHSILSDRPTKLFIVLAGFFITNALLAEIIGVKIFQLETSLGFAKLDYSIFGFKHLSLQYTCGVILWPIVFVMTDLINEYYGRRGVQYLSLMTAGLILFGFGVFYLALHASPADWWLGSSALVGDYNDAYRAVIGQGSNIIIGSLAAFIISQLLDVFIFTKLKKITGEKNIWIRATGSTLVSQFIDSFVVLYIAFYIGANWSGQQVAAIAFNNYFYKAIMALALTPVLYLVHYGIELYLGRERATAMKQAAMNDN